LSRVYGSVTSNNWFWIGWLHLLTPPCTISLNHNQLQYLLINLLPNPSSLTVEESPHSHSLSFWLLIYDWTTYVVSRRTHKQHIRCPVMDICKRHRKHLFFCCTSAYSALHSSGSYPIVACVFDVAGMCLPSRCPATGLHVTILSHGGRKTKLKMYCLLSDD
jgi:hypothetical protein